ncbi:MAG: hypothetical protein FWE28_04405, partial [Oscillospiraceae bacterium]|nr:hypothetical protein [Oscillospiraceae bacterium]
MPKKKRTKQERTQLRLQKAKQWVLTYKGSHIVRAYRKRFQVDYSCALRDLEAIGAIPPERLATLKAAEEIRLQKKREDRESKQLPSMWEHNPDCDDTFFYIAGYTSGGAPYGVTWEEMGMTPY